MAIRTLVVDDSIVFRKCVRDALSAIPDVEVVDIARDGTAAIEKIVRLRPDLVTLDVEMPGLDGLGVLEELGKRNVPANVIMLSSLTRRGAEVTTQALSLGALDFILKPESSSVQENLLLLQRELSKRIGAFQHRLTGGRQSSTPALGVESSATGRLKADRAGVTTLSKVEPKASGFRAGSEGQANGQSDISMSRSPAKASPALTYCDLVVIGISTGGPKALAQVVPEIPGAFPVPIVIVQHMPPLFTATMASHLDARSELKVIEATDGLVLSAGQVVIAPGGRQMALESTSGDRLMTRITDASPIKGCKPSVDYCLSSLDAQWAGRTLAVIMTGMGDDGLDGCRELARLGGSVWAQSEASCTVYGMPRQVVDQGLTDSIFNLPDLSNWLTGLHRSSRPGRRTRRSIAVDSNNSVAGPNSEPIGGAR